MSASDRPHRLTARRVAIGVLAVFLLAGLLLVAAVAYAIAFGAIVTDLVLSGTVSVNGSINVTLFLVALAGGVGVLLVASLRVLYGDETVEAAVDDVQEATDSGGDE